MFPWESLSAFIVSQLPEVSPSALFVLDPSWLHPLDQETLALRSEPCQHPRILRFPPASKREELFPCGGAEDGQEEFLVPVRQSPIRLIASVAVVLVGIAWGAVIGGALENRGHIAPGPATATHPAGDSRGGQPSPTGPAAGLRRAPTAAATRTATATSRPQESATPTGTVLRTSTSVAPAGDLDPTPLPTREAEVSPPPASTAEPTANAQQTYTVQAGDIFFRIARRFGITVEELQRANPGVDPETLQVGQVILIPPPSTPTTGPAGPG